MKINKTGELVLVSLLLLFSNFFYSIKTDNIQLTNHINYEIPSETEPAEWLLMVYLDGDIDYELFVVDALNEFEAGFTTTDEIVVIILIDRSPIYDKSCGDWTGARYYRLLPGNNPMSIESELLVDLGNKNMGASLTLRNFVSYATTNYPAEKKALILVDHGDGLTGICIDHTSNYDILKIDEVQQAMNGFHVDLLVTEACIMGFLEVAYEWSTFTDYYAASQNSMYTESMNFEAVMIELCANPTMQPLELAEIIGQTYFDTYEFPTFQTYSIINCTALAPVINSINNLSKVLISRVADEIDEIQQMRIELSCNRQIVDLGNLINAFEDFYSDNQTILDILYELELNYNRSVLLNFNGRYTSYNNIYIFGHTGMNIVFFYDNQSLYLWHQYLNQSESGYLTNVDFFDQTLWDDFQANYTAIAPIVEEIIPIENPLLLNQNYQLNLDGKVPIIYSLEITEHAIFNFTLSVESGDINFELTTPIINPSFRTMYILSYYVNPEERNIEQIIYWMKPGIVYVNIYSYGNSTGNLIVSHSEPKPVNINDEITGEFPPTFGNFPPGTIYNYYTILLDEGSYEVMINSSWPVGLEVAIIDEEFHVLKNELNGIPGGNFTYTINLYTAQAIIIGFGSYTGTGIYTFIVTSESEETTENGNLAFVIIPVTLTIIVLINVYKKKKNQE